MPLDYSRYLGMSGAITPSGGSANTFGSRVAPITMPNPYSDLSKVYPNLSGTNAAVSSSIASKLAGQLSPETLNGIQDDAARFGVSSGMPGIGGDSLASHYGLYRGVFSRENLQQQGIQDYNSTIPTVSGTQTVNPSTQVAVNEQNNVNAAAPDPGAAATYAQQLFDKYLATMRGPGGGTGGSRGTVTASPSSGGWHPSGSTTPGLGDSSFGLESSRSPWEVGYPNLPTLGPAGSTGASAAPTFGTPGYYNASNSGNSWPGSGTGDDFQFDPGYDFSPYFN